MTTLVTGAGGFIGSAVVRALLRRGRQVRCALAPAEPEDNLRGLEVDLVRMDVRDRDAVGQAMRGAKVVYHLAALYKLWVADPRRIYDINVEGARNVLLAARKAEVERLVFTSSVAAVGHHEGQLADERTEFNQWRQGNDYIRSKWLSEREALAMAADGLPVVVVNPSFPFGERDREPTPTGRTILEALGGTLPATTVGGMNVVNVDDCAEGHVLAEERGRIGERYILGSHNVTHRDFFAAVARVGGSNRRALHAPRWAALAYALAHEGACRLRAREPYYTVSAVRFAARHLWFDTARATRELGMPKRPLDETIGRSIRWFRDHGYLGR